MAKHQTKDGKEGTCNICLKNKQWWTITTHLECFSINETRSKNVGIKASKVSKCRNHANDPRSFAQLFSAMFKDHLMTNLMVDKPGKVYLFKTDFKSRLDFPCRREIIWCTARHESNITKDFLKDLDTCINCTCPFGEIGNRDTQNIDKNSKEAQTDIEDPEDDKIKDKNLNPKYEIPLLDKYTKHVLSIVVPVTVAATLLTTCLVIFCYHKCKKKPEVHIEMEDIHGEFNE